MADASISNRVLFCGTLQQKPNKNYSFTCNVYLKNSVPQSNYPLNISCFVNRSLKLIHKLNYLQGLEEKLVRFKMHFSVSYGKNQNTGTCSDSSDMQPERQTGTKHTHSPTLDKCIKLTSSTASCNPAHRASREGDLLQVFTQVICADENIHCHKEGGTGKRQTAYPSELLDATKYPHHSINLLLQPPGPVLHTARDRETERKRKGEKEREKESEP